MMNDKAALEKVMRARTALVLKHPFFASLALRLDLQEDRSCRTAWTDGQTFAYNPHYIDLLPAEKLEGLAAHIVMHPACSHHLRRGHRDPEAWNRACDYAINWILLDAGFTLPDGHLCDDRFRGQGAESIYEILMGEQNETEEKEPEGSENDEQGQEHEPADETGEQTNEEQTGEQESSDDPGLSGEVRDAPQLGTSSDAQAETDWEEALIQAAHNAREVGNLPAGLERLVERIVEPVLPWQQILSRFIERSARSDYTWLTPNRRYLHKNLYFPSLLNAELNEVVIAVDTSGSINPEDIERFAAEISAIMEQYPATMYLMYCDVEVYDFQILHRSDLPMQITAKGGGGTDYRPVFERVEKEGIRPACLIYLTDLECEGFPGYEPEYPVLWVQTGTSLRKPPFGDVLHVQEIEETP